MDEKDKDSKYYATGLDQNQYNILMKYVTSQNVIGWNLWKERNSDVLVLNGADFSTGFPNGANFAGFQLNNSRLNQAKLNNANFYGANLSCSDILMADLDGAKLIDTNLCRSNFSGSSIDKHTIIQKCSVTKKTDFRFIDLDSCRIDTGTKALLKYNTRRLNWQDWYKNHKIQMWPAKLFWWLSDYGKSPKRLLSSFVIISFVFALFIAGYEKFIFLPSNNPIPETLPFGLLFLHYWFSSIVTMVSLGSYPEPPHGYLSSAYASAFLILISYFLLAALVAYIGIVYTSDGPAGLFADEIEKREERKKQKEYYKSLRRAVRDKISYFQ